MTPRKQLHRQIPFLVREDAEKELERLEKLDIIEFIRICVDMQEANKAIKREKHHMPTIDDRIANLNGANHFSTLDLSSGYHQLELAPESRYFTTFSRSRKIEASAI